MPTFLRSSTADLSPPPATSIPRPLHKLPSACPQSNQTNVKSSTFLTDEETASYVAFTSEQPCDSTHDSCQHRVHAADPGFNAKPFFQTAQEPNPAFMQQFQCVAVCHLENHSFLPRIGPMQSHIHHISEHNDLGVCLPVAVQRLCTCQCALVLPLIR